MKKRMWFPLLLMALAAGTAVASAQSPPTDSLRIEVPDLGPERAVERDVTGEITVLVDGLQCGVLDLKDGGDVALDLRASAVDANCLKIGAEISFVNQHGQTLFERYRLEPGVSIVLTNLAPEPPADNGVQPPAAGTGGPESRNRISETAGLYASVILLGGLALVAVAWRRRTD